MADIVALRADLAAAIEALPGTTPTALGSDYRDDLEAIAPGATRYQLRTNVSGQHRDSNETRQVAHVVCVVKHRLTDPLDERTFTGGALQDDLEQLMTLDFWRNHASVYDVVEVPTGEVTRIGAQIVYTIECVLVIQPT